MLTAQQYFERYWGSVPVVADLFNSIQQGRIAEASSSKAASGPGFKAHWSPATIEQGLNNGSVFQVNALKVLDLLCLTLVDFLLHGGVIVVNCMLQSPLEACRHRARSL